MLCATQPLIYRGVATQPFFKVKMATKIRLARHGKKNYPFYHIVVADSRAPRDGKFIEKLGTYNPNTNPATIEINFDSALKWVGTGAQPTDTVRAILSYKGVMYKHHLLGGVRKGAFSEEVAEQRFAKWLEEKEAKIEAARKDMAGKEAKAARERLAEETKVKETKASALASKLAAAAKAAAGNKETEEVMEEAVERSEEVVEAAVEAAAEEMPAKVAAEEAPVEAAAPAEEAKEEAPAAEDASVEVVAEEAPAEVAVPVEEASAEAAAEEAPAEEAKEATAE